MNKIIYFENGERKELEVEKDKQTDEIIKLLEKKKGRNDGHFKRGNEYLRNNGNRNNDGKRCGM